MGFWWTWRYFQSGASKQDKLHFNSSSGLGQSKYLCSTSKQNSKFCKMQFNLKSINNNMPEISNAAWYVVHTKPRQETRALENLQNQGFECFLPTMEVEKLRNQRVMRVVEPMFSRYMFIQLDDTTQNWGGLFAPLWV